MSGSARTPLSRPQRRRFSLEALAVFRKLRRVRGCTCPPIDWEGKYWERGEPCAACRRYKELHSQLFHAWPDVRPWYWPIVERPDAPSPYPSNHGGNAKWHEMHREAAARWVTIETALVEHDRRRSAARA